MSAPYISQMFPSDRPQMLNEWAHTGYRRGLANYPHFVDARGGDIVVSEHDNHRIQVFDKAITECRFNPFGERGNDRNQFLNPSGVTTTNIPGSQMVVADTGNKRVCFVGISTTQHGYGQLTVTHSFGGQIFEEPVGLEVDVNRNVLMVTDRSKRRVTMHEMTRGDMIGETSPLAGLIGPVDVTSDSKSLIYVSDTMADRISVFDRNGDFMFHFGEGILYRPWGLCFDRSGDLIVSDGGNDRILLFNGAGQLLKEVATGIMTPKGVSVTIHDNIVVATGDPYNFLKVIKFK